jgi:tRNA pseudouridine(55) synthase
MGELITRMKENSFIGEDERVTFAGRLDPLARGITILLKNDARFEKEAYTSLPKTYEFEVILGMETDTLDVLGTLTRIDDQTPYLADKEACATFKNSLQSLVGAQLQTYPQYSSKTIKGKPLFEYARSNEEVTRPSHTIHIYELELISVSKIKKNDFLKSVHKSIEIVRGDFRQKEILRSWENHSAFLPDVVTSLKCKVICSSGTYVRVLATDIASLLSTFALADNIERVKIGEFTKSQIIV